VTVTDANGCRRITEVVIPSRASFTVSANMNNINASCGASNGRATATITGGTAPFTYLWSNGGNTATIANLAAGTYGVTATDASGCQNTASTTINAVGNLTVSATKTDASCGIANGTITLTTTGTAPYTYLWSNGATTRDLTLLGAGIYRVTVTDANRCTATATVTILQGTTITVTPTVRQPLCAGQTGSATVSVMGGSAPYRYAWSNGSTTASVSNLTAGSNTIMVTDANGCSGSQTFTIAVPTAISLTATTTNVACNGTSTGGIVTSVSGGTPNYSYLWSNGATGANLSNVGAGNYSLTVTDANGCTTTGSWTLTQPSAILISATGANTTCGASNGSITASVTGGSPNYTYLWSNGATTANISNLAGGNYTLTVRDANGCTAMRSVTITQGASNLAVSVSAVQARCIGQTGSATATATGGVGTITYRWSNGATTAAITGLLGNTYTVVATDGNGCTASASVVIVIPTAISLTATTTNIACNGTSTGGIVTLVSGGTPNYSYLWSNNSTSANLSNIGAGTYNLTVTDANGCTTTGSWTLTQPSAIVISATGANTTCGSSNGSIVASVTGGSPNYTYLWSNGATTANISNLAGGNYTLTVRDANGCMATRSVTVTQGASNLAVSVSAVQARCIGQTGSATATATGGVGTITYRWSNGATTAAIMGLLGNTYTVVATDGNGCTASASVVIVIPTAISLTATTTNVACNGTSTGGIVTSVSGGTPNYSYLWSNNSTSANLSNIGAGTYNLTVTDANGCTTTGSWTLTQPSAIVISATGANTTCGSSNGSITASVTGGSPNYTYLWSNGATTANISNLAGGNYTLTVRDANGCTATRSVTIGSSTPITINPTVVNVVCAGAATGSVSLAISGGTLPYRYTWSNGATTATINGLPQGVYRVTVTDANNCTANEVYSIVQPAAITLTTTSINATCGAANGSARVTATGGSTTYTYLWSNGTNLRTLSGVIGGTYSVTVTDGNSCSVNTTVNIGSTPGITAVNLLPTNATCLNNDGAISLTVTGGASPFTYLWSNAATSSSITGLSAGNYSVTVTDANSCTASASVTLTAPSALVINLNRTNTSCGLNNGTINASVSGGTTPYSYAWTGGATAQNLTNLSAGSYILSVRDAAGCAASQMATVGASTAMNLLVSANNVTCNAATNGGAVVSISGGRSPYSYLWSNTATSSGISNLVAGNYLVTVTDADNCRATGMTEVTQPTAINIGFVGTPASCTPTGAISASVTGGVPNYRYSWSNGGTTATINNVASGTYTLSVTDANGCLKIAAATINANISPNLSCTVAVVQNVSDVGANDGSLSVTPANGQTPYRYRWSNGGLTATVTSLAEGNYSVTVTDAYNCTTVCSRNIAPICDNVTDGGLIEGNQNLCPGGNATDITEIAPIMGGSGIIEYMWMRGTDDVAFNTTNYTAIPNSNAPNLTNIGVINQTTYFFRCVRRRGCPFIEGNRITKTVDLSTAYVAPSTACVNQDVNFEALDTRPNISYSWSFGASATHANSTSRTPTVRFTAAGNYVVRLFLYRNGCTANLMIPISVTSCATGGGSALSSFTAKVNAAKNVELAWTTENETPQNRFFIERSPDGLDFKTLTELEGQGGVFNNYRYTDQFPKKGVAFYRLRNVNRRGDVTLSEMKRVMITDSEDEAKVLIYPNPMINLAFLEVLSNDYNGGATIEIYNQQGIKVFTKIQEAQQSRLKLELNDLPSGVYFARVKLDNGDVKTASFVKLTK
jgi:hypothetical protein